MQDDVIISIFNRLAYREWTGTWMQLLFKKLIKDLQENINVFATQMSANIDGHIVHHE